MGAAPWGNINPGTNGGEMAAEGGKVDPAQTTGIPGGGSPSTVVAIRVRDSPSFSVQVSPSPSFFVQYPEPASSLAAEPSAVSAPVSGRTPYEALTWHRPHGRFTQGGYSRKDAKDVSETRLALIDAAEAKRIPLGGDGLDTPGTIAGRRERASAGEVMEADTPAESLGEKCRAGDPHLASVAEK